MYLQFIIRLYDLNSLSFQISSGTSEFNRYSIFYRSKGGSKTGYEMFRVWGWMKKIIQNITFWLNFITKGAIRCHNVSVLLSGSSDTQKTKLFESSGYNSSWSPQYNSGRTVIVTGEAQCTHDLLKEQIWSFVCNNKTWGLLFKKTVLLSYSVNIWL